MAGGKAKSVEPPEPIFEDKKRQRDKRISILEGSLNSISVGFTDTFITAFAVALGVSNTTIAMLNSMPRLLGAVVQLWVQRIQVLFKTRKRHIVFFAILQSLMWLPLLFAPQLQQPGGYLLLFVTFNAVFSMLISPVWSSFMGDVIEENERGRFFGRRNMFTGLTAFFATLLAGWMLDLLAVKHPMLGFMILFTFAFVFKFLSAYLFSTMDDPPEKDLNSEMPDIPRFLANAESNPFGRFTIFLMLFYVAVYISSPFFPVYQLSILKLDYLTFTLLAGTAAIASFLSMITWGKYVDRIGSRNVLVACGFLIPLVPLGYAFARELWILFLIEFFSGIVWAGFNLSVSTYVFDATERKNRTREIAEYTLLIQVAIFLGAMGGSAVLGLFDRTNPAAFYTIFIVSALLRLAVIVLFYKTLQELRIVEVPIKDRVFKRFLSIRPQQGIVYEPTLENVKLAGSVTKEQPKRIQEDVKEFARKARGIPKRPKSQIKRLEEQEDEQDFQEYKKKLKD